MRLKKLLKYVGKYCGVVCDYTNYYKIQLGQNGLLIPPQALLDVDPHAIEYVISNRAHYPRNPSFGVYAGDWDSQKSKHDDTTKHQSMVAHFEKGVPWDKTSRYREVVKRIEQGERVGGFDASEQTIEHYQEYLSWIDELYNTIKEEGYKSQRELTAQDDFMQRTNPIPEYNEITVDIDRYGNFLATHGIHRLSIAKILDIETVPVRVRVRHKKWQEIRTKFHNEYPDSIPDKLLQYKTHPDIQPIIQSEWFNQSR